MKRLKIFFTIICILMMFQVNAQKSQHPSGLPIGQGKKEFEISFFMGKSYFGTFKDVKAAMQDAGLIDGGSGHSMMNKRVPYFFEIKLNVSQRSGMAFHIGKEDVVHVRSYPDATYGLRNTGFTYVYSLGHNRHEFSAGLSFLSLNINSKYSVYGESRQKKTGVNLGYSFHFIETRSFFMAIHGHYTWAGNTTVGPYTLNAPTHQYDLFGIFPIQVQGAIEHVPASTLNLNTINLGFSVGFRFGDTVRTSGV